MTKNVDGWHEKYLAITELSICPLKLRFTYCHETDKRMKIVIDRFQQK